MASEIKLPELGENLESGEVLAVKVAPGDTVTEGQTLLEMEAEKSTVEVPSPMAGRVGKVVVNKGDQLQVGQTICFIEGSNKDDGAPTSNEAESTSGTEPKPKEAARESGGEEPTPAEEEAVAEGVEAEEPGAAKKEAGGNGRRQEAEPKPTSPSARQKPSSNPRAGKVIPAGPATRRLARELGVDLGQVTGTGPGGRVSPEDVKTYVQELAAGGGAGPGIKVPPLPDFERWGPVERQALEPVRRKTAEQMSLAWSLIPHVTQHDQADVTDLDAFRKQQESSGPKLTVTAFALKAAASALKQFPQFNASLDPAAGQIILKRYFHIGVAVDTGRGLLVPVLRDVDRKSVRDLAQELAEVAERGRQKKIPVEEMRGGTFTITNLGGIGGTGFTPIVNYPEVAILGMARARLQPVIRNGEVVARLILPLSLSYDHRVIDGADAARFTRRIAEMLENPLLILM